MKTKKLTVSRLLAFLMALIVPLLASAQEVTIRGVVKDNSGYPLPGVNVIVEGTTNGTISNMDGEYQIKAPSDGALIYSFIGFNNQTQPIEGRTVIDVVLEEESLDLDEVVVVGYGQMKKIGRAHV